MKRFFSIFKIRSNERVFVGVLLALMLFLNAIVVCEHYDKLTPISKYYWPLFIRNFHISGFDPITYSIVTDWWAGYNVFRHPLLAFFMYPFYLLNKGLMFITGINCAIFIVPVIQIFCATYSFVFLFRILRNAIKISTSSAIALTFLFFSFAYIMLSTMVPDHFIMSMFMLLFTLYFASHKMVRNEKITKREMIFLFVGTAGTSLNNGLKVFLAQLFVNKKAFFNIKNILFAIIIPCAIIWGFARWEYTLLVYPIEKARKEAKKTKQEKMKKEKQLALNMSNKNVMSNLQVGTKKDFLSKDTILQNKPQPHKKQKRIAQGAPIAQGEFLRWTDITTSRSQTIVENLFGESLQLHTDHCLGDTLISRPIIVKYQHWFNYVIEAIVVALFVAGLVFGLKQRFMLLVVSWWILDMSLHLGLGFAINEIYIMTAHWAFIIPIAMAYLFKRIEGKQAHKPLLCVVASVATFLILWNIYNIVNTLT